MTEEDLLDENSTWPPSKILRSFKSAKICFNDFLGMLCCHLIMWRLALLLSKSVKHIIYMEVPGWHGKGTGFVTLDKVWIECSVELANVTGWFGTDLCRANVRLTTAWLLKNWKNLSRSETSHRPLNWRHLTSLLILTFPESKQRHAPRVSRAMHQILHKACAH